jgi:hypothetical protein
LPTAEQQEPECAPRHSPGLERCVIPLQNFWRPDGSSTRMMLHTSDDLVSRSGAEWVRTVLTVSRAGSIC